VLRDFKLEMMSSIFWDKAQCSQLKVNGNFTQLATQAGYFFDLLFNPADGGDMFLRNVD
jgi:hypothetical protein